MNRDGKRFSVFARSVQSKFLSVLLRIGGVLCLCAAMPAPARGLPAVKLKEVAVPIYADGQSGPVAVLKVQRFFRENRKVGFFRVKLMPVLVGEDVKLEFLQTEVDATALAQVYAGLLRLAKSEGFELRSMSFWFAGESAARLEAVRVQPQSAAARKNSTQEHPSLVLEDATMRIGDQTWRWPRALLHMAGPEAARVQVESRRAETTIDLFHPNSSRIHSQKEPLHESTP